MALDWMVTVIPMNGMRLDGYSYSYKWYEIGWLQLFLQMVRDWMVKLFLRIA
jgi:hypothetical protein